MLIKLIVKLNFLSSSEILQERSIRTVTHEENKIEVAAVVAQDVHINGRKLN